MKTYYMRFGGGDPRTYTGLVPVFQLFVRSDGAAVTPPTISEVTAGSGIYAFSYGVTQSISFLADAATTSPGSQGRYVTGSIDPNDRMDEYGTTLIAQGTTAAAVGTTLTAIGTTLAAQNTTITFLVSAIGTPASSFGTASVDPVDLFGYLKRILENFEGNETFLKASGQLTQYSRGSSVTLWSKTVANSVSLVIKS